MQHVVSDFLEQVGGKYEIVECFVGGTVNLFFVPDPLAVSFVDEYDVLAYSQHRIHVVCVYDGCDSVFVGDVAKKLVYHNRSTGVETGVRLVTEKIFGVKRYCARYGHTLLHAAGNF